MSENAPGLYVRDAEGDERYLSDGRGGQKYADADPPSRRYAVKVDGSEYYAKMSNGDEYYPQHEGGVLSPARLADGTEIYVKNVFGDEAYPIDALRNDYFARDAKGDEYGARLRTGVEIPPYPTRYPESAEGVPRYLRDEDGRSYFPFDEQGDECYILRDPKTQNVVFGTDASGNQVYARDRDGGDLYPPDGTFAVDVKGDAVYARDRRGYVIFKTDAGGDELYLPHLRRPSIDRYAKTVVGAEKYPEFVGELGTFQFVVESTYARDGAGRSYYPRGWNGDEYVDLDAAGMELGYPLSRDGFCLVPDRAGEPALVAGWGVTASDLIGVTEGSGNGKYYVTKVDFDEREKRRKERGSRWNFTKTALICLFLTLTSVTLVLFAAMYLSKV